MYEVVIGLQEPPYERILEVEASPSPGKPPDTSGPPGSGGPGYPPSSGIKKVRFADDDPIESDQGKEVPPELFSEHEEEISDQVLEEKSKRHNRRRNFSPEELKR